MYSYYGVYFAYHFKVKIDIGETIKQSCCTSFYKSQTSICFLCGKSDIAVWFMVEPILVVGYITNQNDFVHIRFIFK